MIEPTVGRIVLFTPDVNDCDLSYKLAPYAAIIADVIGIDPGFVNLTVLGKQGNTYPRTKVVLTQGTMIANLGGAFCTWMDYQHGQAAKSDELVAALTARIEALEALEAKNQFDFEARRVERRVEALEAAEAVRIAAVGHTTPAFIGIEPQPVPSSWRDGGVAMLTDTATKA